MLAIEHPRQRKVLYGSVAIVAIVGAFAVLADPLIEMGTNARPAVQRANGWGW